MKRLQHRKLIKIKVLSVYKADSIKSQAAVAELLSEILSSWLFLSFTFLPVANTMKQDFGSSR